MSPRTIVFVHGAWVTARCWDPFIRFFTERGHACIAPSWPYKDGSPAELRASPPPRLAGLGVREIVDHFDGIVRALPEPPIIVGHSFGGLFTQMLLDRGLGAAGVALDPAPPRGVLAFYPSSIRSNLGALTRWAGWSTIVPASFDAFAYGFLNTLAPDAQRRVYEEQATPETGRIFYQAAFALLDRERATEVAFANARRAPLLITAGSKDNNVPPQVSRATYGKYRRSPARTDLLELAGRSHWLIAEPGWEDVARRIEQWWEGVLPRDQLM